MGLSRDQAGDQGTEQGFAAPASVVHELEEAEVERQLVLREAAVRAQPGAELTPSSAAAFAPGLYLPRKLKPRSAARC